MLVCVPCVGVRELHAWAFVSHTLFSSSARAADLDRQQAYSEAQLKRIMFDHHPHDYDKLPIRPGVHFFEMLAPPPRGSRDEERRTSGRLRVNVPDTVVFSEGVDGFQWYYTSTEGYVYRTDDGTDRHLLSRIGHEAEDQHDLLVAVYKKPSALNKHTANDTMLLSTKTLMACLSSLPARPFYIQKFVAFKGKKANMVRCIYDFDRAPRAFVISSTNFVDDTAISDFKRRLTVITAEPKLCSVYKLTGRSLFEVGDAISSIVSYVEQNVTPRPSFKQLVADFIKDADGRWWLLNVKHFTLQERTLRHIEALTRSASVSLVRAHVQTTADRSAASRRDSYLMMLTCHCCRTRCAQDELVYELTLKMILETVQHLKQRGVTLRWFKALEGSTVILEDKAKLYAAQKVCRYCYDLFLTEQKLQRMVRRFAIAIGVPVSGDAAPPSASLSIKPESSALTSSSARKGTPAPLRPMPDGWAYGFQFGESVQVAPDNENYRPPDMRLYRFIIFLHELYDAPDLPELFGDGTFFLQFTIFNYTTRIPLQLVPGSILPVHKLRVFSFFADETGLIEFIERQQKLEVSLFTSMRTRPLSSTSLYLKQFASGLVSKLDFFQLFSTREMAECGLKATLGFVKLRDIADPASYASSTTRHLGVFIPTDPGFYSCDPLPEEWLAIIPNRHNFLESLPESVRASRTRSGEHGGGAGSRSAAAGPAGKKAFVVTELSATDEVALQTRLETLARRFAGRTYDRQTERRFLVKLCIDEAAGLDAIEGEHFKVDYTLLGEDFSSGVVRFERAKPLPFNLVDDIHLNCSYDGLRAWLAKFPRAEFDVVSRERSAGGSVSVKLEPLLSAGFVSARYPLAKIVGDIASRRAAPTLAVSIYIIDPDDADASDLMGPLAAGPGEPPIRAAPVVASASGASGPAAAKPAAPAPRRGSSSDSSDHRLNPAAYDSHSG